METKLAASVLVISSADLKCGAAVPCDWSGFCCPPSSLFAAVWWLKGAVTFLQLLLGPFVAVVSPYMLPLCAFVVWLLDLLYEGSHDLPFITLVVGCRPYVCCYVQQSSNYCMVEPRLTGGAMSLTDVSLIAEKCHAVPHHKGLTLSSEWLFPCPWWAMSTIKQGFTYSLPSSDLSSLWVKSCWERDWVSLFIPVTLKLGGLQVPSFLWLIDFKEIWTEPLTEHNTQDLSQLWWWTIFTGKVGIRYVLTYFF
jgi:hypothetical protein